MSKDRTATTSRKPRAPKAAPHAGDGHATGEPPVLVAPTDSAPQTEGARWLPANLDKTPYEGWSGGAEKIARNIEAVAASYDQADEASRALPMAYDQSTAFVDLKKDLGWTPVYCPVYCEDDNLAEGEVADLDDYKVDTRFLDVAAIIARLLRSEDGLRLFAQKADRAPDQVARYPRVCFHPPADTCDDLGIDPEAEPTPMPDGRLRYVCQLTKRAFFLSPGAPIPAVAYDTYDADGAWVYTYYLVIHPHLFTAHDGPEDLSGYPVYAGLWAKLNRDLDRTLSELASVLVFGTLVMGTSPEKIEPDLKIAFLFREGGTPPPAKYGETTGQGYNWSDAGQD